MALISRSDFDLLMVGACEANRGTKGRVAANNIINISDTQVFVLTINSRL